MDAPMSPFPQIHYGGVSTNAQLHFRNLAWLPRGFHGR